LLCHSYRVLTTAAGGGAGAWQGLPLAALDAVAADAAGLSHEPAGAATIRARCGTRLAEYQADITGAQWRPAEGLDTDLAVF
jgi:hypothetical protein